MKRAPNISLILGAMMIFIAPGILLVAQAIAGDAPQTQPEVVKPKPGEVAVGKLVYGNGWRDDCFSSAFLDEASRESKIALTRQLQLVSLTEPDKLRAYPMIIMSGSWKFTLPEAESKNLREYLTKGGFLLASAHCEHASWAASFRTAMAAALPEGKWVVLKPKHKLYHTPFDINTLRAKQATERDLSLEALMIEDRIVCVFSPIGLSDTDSLPANCCCCGANELKDARKINANILLFVIRSIAPTAASGERPQSAVGGLASPAAGR